MGEPQWFRLRYGRFSKPLLTLLGLGPSRSSVVAGGNEVVVQMGWSFDGHAPATTVTAARPVAGTVISRGVHGWRGRWLVNGDGTGLVEILFDPPMRGHVLFVPVKIRRLIVSAEDPTALTAVLESRGDA